MRFFFDNNLSPYYARALDVLIRPQGDSATHLRDKFPQNADDIDWIKTLGAEGQWVIISGDPDITRVPHEKAAWLQSGLTAFFFHKQFQNLVFWDQIAKLIQRWPLISEQAKRVEAGAGFLVSPRTLKFEQVRIR